MSIENLWGGLEGIDSVRTPSMILQEQAGLLGKLTNEVLQGKVKRDPLSELREDSNVKMTLYIVAPALQGYSVKILDLDYSYTTAYPVKVTNSLEGSLWRASSESDLTGILKDILSSQRVTNIVAALIAESRMSIVDPSS
ncbi:MAG: hypothetical protein OXI80_01865 [Caldilineaceae bacterium]|nr:hypothetical protein [Caldilineaceae bacterium]MDE0336392.1 hypothetical protein [Caldilineaceae bacterium]